MPLYSSHVGTALVAQATGDQPATLELKDYTGGTRFSGMGGPGSASVALDGDEGQYIFARTAAAGSGGSSITVVPPAGQTVPLLSLQASNGDPIVQVFPYFGLVLYSPNGTPRRLKVSDAGVLSTGDLTPPPPAPNSVVLVTTEITDGSGNPVVEGNNLLSITATSVGGVFEAGGGAVQFYDNFYYFHAPAMAVGTYDVKFFYAGGSIVLPNALTYADPPPPVPDSIVLITTELDTGGGNVIVEGNNLLTIGFSRVGGVYETGGGGMHFEDPVYYFSAPPMPAGTYDVEFFYDGGSIVLSNALTYV